VHAVSATHSLVRGVRDLFASGKLSYDIEYLKPQKRLLPDIIVSLGCLDRALSFASQLYKSLDSAGYRTVIAAHGEACSRAEVVLHEGKNGNSHLGLWSPGRCTVVYVNETPIGLTIFEATEKVSMRYVGGRYVRESEYKPPKHSRHSADNTWTTTKDCPSGRLCLQAYSPFDGKTWLQWRSERNLDLATRIPEIVRAMPRGAAEIKERHDAAMREREEMFRRWDEDERQRKEAEAKRKAAAAAQASRDELRAFVAEWDEQRRLTAFFEQAEQRIRMLDVHKQAALLERARLAKALIGDSDPLFRLLEWQTPEERLRR
jgi:Sec-independent protein translocase protein TatA